jgi:hypothetical protein
MPPPPPLKDRVPRHSLVAASVTVVVVVV